MAEKEVKKISTQRKDKLVTSKEQKISGKKEEKNVIEKSVLSYAVGRRKRSVARARMYKGTGQITVNNKDINNFFTVKSYIKDIYKPLEAIGAKDEYDFTIKVVGGGTTGQYGASYLAISRCLAKVNEDVKNTLARHKMLTRDPREKERKKVYRIGARKVPQFSKR